MEPQNRDLALLFDLDGTLVDTAYQHVLARSAALRSAGLAAPAWKIHRRIGMSGRALVRQLVRELGRRHGKVKIDALEKKHDTAFNKIGAPSDPCPARANCWIISRAFACPGPLRPPADGNKRGDCCGLCESQRRQSS